MEVFPEAKCIIWARNVDEWFESYKSSHNHHLNHTSKKLYASTALNPILKPLLKLFSPTLYKMVEFDAQNLALLNGYSKKLNEIHCKRAYRQHLVSLLATCPPEKLLYFEKLTPQSIRRLAYFCCQNARHMYTLLLPYKKRQIPIIEELLKHNTKLSRKVHYEVQTMCKALTLIFVAIFVTWLISQI